MIELTGKYNKAKVYTDNVEQTAIGQIIELCNQEFTEGSSICIMPDTHSGAGCTIGTTMTLTDKVVPNLVGVDIGCGMETTKLKDKNIDLEKLDNFIRNNIPHGQKVRNIPHKNNNLIDLEELKCKKYLNLSRAISSVGTLGGGNHFIEINKDDNDELYLVIHSGSRYLGKQIAEYYQKKAIKYHKDLSQNKKDMVSKLKKEGRDSEIQQELSKMRKPKMSDSLCYLEGKDFDDYIHDMQIAQEYASLNRMSISQDIVKGMELSIKESFTTIHNYIDMDTKILRKGAISAKLNERVLIPINMRDGSIIAIGKGNNEWNQSAPHGAGRILSRSKAKEKVSLEEFEQSMTGIFTTSVGVDTIDESPMAYKPMEEILGNIVDTVDVLEVIKPIYNFKSSK